MDSWKRSSDNYNQEVTRTRSHNRKPPLGSWQPTVPSWEKKFCTVVGSVPWRKLLDNKKFIHLYDNVLKWNDSACEEAFNNAKNRFWAEINGLPCDISLPDPDIYIDKIDWNSSVDPELLLDLEREFVLPADREKGEQVVILSETLVSSQLFSSTGWGDAEDDLKKMTDSTLENKANQWELNGAQANGVNGWDDGRNDSWSGNPSNGAVKDCGWEDGWNNSCSWNRWEDNNCWFNNLKNGRTTRVREPWDGNIKNRENTGGRYMSRYRTSRFHGFEHQTNREQRNEKGRKRTNFVDERWPCMPSFIDKPVAKQWNLMNSCRPVSHRGSTNPGDGWSQEKPVS